MSRYYNKPFGGGWTRLVCNNLPDEDGWIDNHDEIPEDDDSDEESYDEIARRENRILDQQERR